VPYYVFCMLRAKYVEDLTMYTKQLSAICNSDVPLLPAKSLNGSLAHKDASSPTEATRCIKIIRVQFVPQMYRCYQQSLSISSVHTDGDSDSVG